MPIFEKFLIYLLIKYKIFIFKFASKIKNYQKLNSKYTMFFHIIKKKTRQNSNNLKIIKNLLLLFNLIYIILIMK